MYFVSDFCNIRIFSSAKNQWASQTYTKEDKFWALALMVVVAVEVFAVIAVEVFVVVAVELFSVEVFVMVSGVTLVVQYVIDFYILIWACDPWHVPSNQQQKSIESVKARIEEFTFIYLPSWYLLF